MGIYEKKKGITLIELIIALGLMGVISVLVFTFFFSNQEKLNEVGIKSDLQYEAKNVLENISKYAMEATSAKWNGSGNSKKLSFDIVSESGEKIEKGIELIMNNKTKEIILKSIDGRVTTISESFKSARVDINDPTKLKFKLTLEKEGVSYSIQDSYVFRNINLK